MHQQQQPSLNCSKLIMGTWQVGGEYWVNVDDRESVRAIHAALACGITSFDTAEEYGAGRSEQVLGKALVGRRHEAVLLSKVFSDHLRQDQVIESCHRSLRHLGTDYLDLYQIHWPSGSFGGEAVPIEETMAALNELRRAGKIRAIGVSNFTPSQLAQAAACGVIDSVQSPYSLLWRHAEQQLIPLCQQNRRSFLAYSPLAQGILADRFSAKPSFAPGDHRHANKLFLPQAWPQVVQALNQLRTIAAEKQVSMAQLSLASLLAMDQVHAIAGARTEAQVKDNAKALQVHLSAEEQDELLQICAHAAAPFIQDPIPWTWEI